jgi:replication initiation and membrane attachment protein DnaB
MTKMSKIQKIPNLLLLVDRDDQLAYFILLTPHKSSNFCSHNMYSSTLLHFKNMHH